MEKKENCDSEDCPECRDINQEHDEIKALISDLMDDPDTNLVNAKGIKHKKDAVDIRPDGTKYYGEHPHFWKIVGSDGKVGLKVNFHGPHGIEGMWIVVVIGNQSEGLGYLDSTPHYTPVNAGDLIMYKGFKKGKLPDGVPLSVVIDSDPKVARQMVKDVGRMTRDCLT